MMPDTKMKPASKTVSVNGRDYYWPQAPLVVICCDGSEPDYMEIAMAEGLMPNLTTMIAKGEYRHGLCVMPSFTNPNNLSIVTGAPPSVHGICGNYLIDPVSGLETMMNDPKWLRAPTIFEKFQKAGAASQWSPPRTSSGCCLARVWFSTAAPFASPPRRPTRRHSQDNGIAGVCAMVGMSVPEVYSAELSEFVFAAGVKLHGFKTRPHVSFDDGLYPAQVCAGHEAAPTSSIR